MTLSIPFYVVSDTHFYHDNIVKFCNRHEQIQKLAGKHIDHNQYMVERWNAVVGPNDPVLHLGDLYSWYNNGRERFEQNILPHLNGRKYLILGNHDKDKPGVYEEQGFTVLKPFVMRYKGQVVSFHHYPWEPGVSDAYFRVHGHIHNNGYPKGPGRDGWKLGTTATALGQINVSVEVIDYTPQRVDALLDQHIWGLVNENA